MEHGAIMHRMAIPSEATYISVDWNYISEEFLEYIGSKFIDPFCISIISDDKEDVLFKEDVNSLANKFNSTQYVGGNLIHISPEVAFDHGDVWMTDWQSTQIDISAYRGKEVILKFSTQDAGDTNYTTAVLLDNIHFDIANEKNKDDLEKKLEDIKKEVILRGDREGAIKYKDIMFLIQSGSFKFDDKGLKILKWWLYGEGNKHSNKVIDLYDGGNDQLSEKQRAWMIFQANYDWGLYMMSSPMLTDNVKALLDNEFKSISNGQTVNINITTDMQIENGESIIGHQYLHGTNSSVGGFKVKGTAKKDENGNVTAQLHFEWNDIIDPNFEYSSDEFKAKLAKSIPGANPTDYTIRIGWDYLVYKPAKNPEWWQIFDMKASWPYEGHLAYNCNY